MVGQLVNWVTFREITKSSTVDPIGNYDGSLTLISKKTFLVKILGHTFDPLSFINIVLLLSACPTTATEHQRRPGVDKADYFLKTEGTFQSLRSRKQEDYF